MNRKKKIEGLFKKRLKRARAKLDARPKAERYVSKAERAKLESEEYVVDSVSTADSTPKYSTDVKTINAGYYQKS